LAAILFPEAEDAGSAGGDRPLDVGGRPLDVGGQERGQGADEFGRDGRVGFAREDWHPEVHRAGNLAVVGQDGGEPPREITGHLGGVDAGVGFRLVEQSRHVLDGRPDAIDGAQEESQVHEAGPVRGGQDVEVVRGFEGSDDEWAQPGRTIHNDVVGPLAEQGEEFPDVVWFDGIRLGRVTGSGQDAEPVGVREEKLFKVLFEVVAVRLCRQGVDDGHMGTETQCRRHLSKLEIEVDEDHPLPAPPGEEGSRVHAEEGLAAPFGGRGDGDDDPVGHGWGRGRVVPAMGDPMAPGEGGGQRCVAGFQRNDIVGAGLDNFGEAGLVLPGGDEKDRQPRGPGVKHGEALEAAPVDEGRAGDHDVDPSRGEEFLHATDLGARDDLAAVGE
jgi:hypothetical protein